MSVAYRAVQWSSHKRTYDALVVAGVALFMGLATLVSTLAAPNGHAASPEIVFIRATGACAFTLLHLILAIGPLARLDRRFIPVLHNRRHLGVITFAVALAHAAMNLVYYHGFGVLSLLRSLLASNTRLDSLRAFPFELLGAGALLILFLMAATSHDFWLRNLGPRAWKRLHMSVYLAYALLVAHVALGAMQAQSGWLIPALLLTGAGTLTTLHLLAARQERARDRQAPRADDWVDVGVPAEIPESRARTVCAGGERIAVFKHAGGFSAVTNLCAHQGGPLGEGKIIDGCVTCPWHGWQYRPQDGCSPPPFTEKIRTYPVRISAGRVQVHLRPNPPGTPVEPARA